MQITGGTHNSAFESLVQLAEARFADLTDGELAILRASARTRQTIPEPRLAGPPTDAFAFGRLRAVRRSFVRWLCLSRSASKHLDARGVRVTQAVVLADHLVPAWQPNVPVSGHDPLEIAHGLIRCRVRFRNCAFPGGILLLSARGQRITLDGCCMEYLDATDVRIASTLRVQACVVRDRINLSHARVEGSVVLDHTSIGEAARPGRLEMRNAVVGGQLRGAGLRVHGLVDLEEVGVSGSIELSGAALTAGPDGFSLVANFASIGRNCCLDCGFHSTGHIRMLGISVGKDLSFSGSTLVRGANEPYVVSLNRAHIEGALFFAPRTSDRRSEHLLGERAGAKTWYCSVTGQIDLRHAWVGRNVRFRNTSVTHPGAVAIWADSLRVGRSFEVQTEPAGAPTATVDGMISMKHLRAGDLIDLTGACILGGVHDGVPGRAAVLARGVRAAGVRLSRGFRADGEVSFTESRIRGDIDCSGGSFCNGEHRCLTLTCAHAGADIELSDGFRAIGAVDLDGVVVQGQIDCRGGWFQRPPEVGPALKAENIYVRDDVLLTPAQRPAAAGKPCTWSLTGWQPGANLSDWRAPTEQDCLVLGRVSLARSRIQGNLDARGVIILRQDVPGPSSVLRESDTALDLQQSRVRGSLRLSVFYPEKENLSPRVVGHVDLRLAHTSRIELARCLLADLSDKHQPATTLYRLYGFTFRDLNATLAGLVVRWVEDSSVHPFAPTTYDQCARVLRRLGRTDEAKDVLIAKSRRELWMASTRAGWTRPFRWISLRGVPAVVGVTPATPGPRVRAWWWFWFWVYGAFLDFGYRPLKPLRLTIAAYLIGLVVFGWTWCLGGMTPAEPDVISMIHQARQVQAEKELDLARRLPEPQAAVVRRAIEMRRESADVRPDELPATYPKFNILIYTADVLLPVVNLRQTDYWMPVPLLSRWVMWGLTLTGWAMSFLVAFGITKLVRDADAEMPDGEN